MARSPNNVVPLKPSLAERPDTIQHFLVALVESSDDAILSKDLDGIITSWNRGAERLFGYSVEEAVGQSITMLIPEDKLNEEQAILERIRQGQTVGHYETVRQCKDGSVVAVSLTVSPVRTIDGEIVGASSIARDITERKRAHEYQLFLVREMQHRTQNLFAVIQSLAYRTLIEPHTLAEAREIFIGRVQALAQAYSMPDHSADPAMAVGVPLTDIINMEFGGFRNHLNIRGCDLVLNTSAAQQFALALHELTTNALKYGALSTPEGRITIECDINRAEGTFSFVWKETGGPAVSPPTRKGFGSTILLESAKQFGRHVSLDYEPDGIRYEVRFPLSAIEASAPQIEAEPC
jgi:two-component system CheB/CheR fusion protein